MKTRSGDAQDPLASPLLFLAEIHLRLVAQSHRRRLYARGGSPGAQINFSVCPLSSASHHVRLYPWYISHSARRRVPRAKTTTTTTPPTGAHLCALTAANDDPPNSRRPSLQTITPVALIFSWLLFDGTTRKCIIRPLARPPAGVAANSTATKSALSSSPSRAQPTASLHTPVSPRYRSLFPIWHAPALSLPLSKLTPDRRRRRGGENRRVGCHREESARYVTGRINYEQKRTLSRRERERERR